MVLVGAQRYVQTLDLAHSGALVLEKGLDRHSQGAIAQADIHKYYDMVRITLLVGWLEDRGCSLGFIGAILRFQTCIRVPMSFLKPAREHAEQNVYLN